MRDPHLTEKNSRVNNIAKELETENDGALL